MNDLQVLLLGPPEIRWKGELLSIQRRIPRSVLFYLAASEGMISRDELLMLFWDDAPSEQARRARLRETLSRLRQTLPNESIIVTNNDLVGLDFKQVFVDQVEFKNTLDEIGQLPWRIPVGDPLPEALYHCLLNAANLWRGPAYLSGANFSGSSDLDDWLIRISENYQNLRKQVFERLSHHALAVGDIEQALRHTQQALETDQLDEALHVRVLEILIDSNEIERARSYYARTEALLIQELGALPGEQLTQISQRLNLPLRQKGLVLPDSWRTHQSLETPFIGRQQALAQLWRCYQKKNSVFLSGETGIGKTRLLQEFLRRQKLSSHLLVHRCTPGGQQSPFQTILDAEFEYGNIRKYVQKIPTIYAREIARLLPRLSDFRPELLDGGSDSHQPNWQLVLEACRQYLLALTEAQQVLFVMEDIQWLDLQTIEVLDYVINRPPFGAKAMLILTARSEECLPATNKYIQTWLAADHMVHIKLERLGLGEVYNLASTILPEPPPPQFVEQLAAETGSNPYFIIETLREAMQHVSNWDISQALPLPISSKLAIIIRSRLEALPSAVRQVFEMAAIIGSEFAPQVIQVALGIDTQTFEQALAELEQDSLIEVSPDTSEVCYRFIHEKFREMILADLKPIRKQTLHRQVAGALVAKYGGRVSFSSLAQHTEQAGDRVKAFEYWLQAGLEAYQANRLQKANELFTQAASLIGRDSSLFTPEAIYRLYRPWLNALLAYKNFKTYQLCCETMLDLGQRFGSSLLMGAALISQAWLSLHMYELDRGLSSIQQARPYLKQIENKFEHLSARNVHATLLYMNDQVEQSMQILQSALDITESVKSESADIINDRAYTHEHIAMIYEIRGCPTLSCQHAQSALAGAIETQNMLGQASAYGHLAFAYYYQGECAQARMYNEFGFRLAQVSGYEHMLGFHYIYYSWIELVVGDPSSSLRDACFAHENGVQIVQPLVTALADRCVADICMVLKQPALALNYYQQTLAYFPKGIARQDTLWRMGLAYLSLGQIDQAQTTFQQVGDYAKQIGADLITFESQLCYARLLFDQGDYDSARLSAENIQSEAEKRSLSQLQLKAEFLLGEIACQTHDLDLARSFFEGVSERAMLRGYAWLEIDARMSLAQILSKQHLPVDAQDQRVQFLLDQIESSISEGDKFPTGEALKKLFLVYRQNIKGLWELP